MSGLVTLLTTNPVGFLIVAGALVLSITIHEFSHAYVAYKLGDSTARDYGRMSLNPLVHLDPLGTIALLLMGFGWGKAVPVNYYNFKNPKRDAALVAFAGPSSNFILAVLLSLVLKVVADPYIQSHVYPIFLLDTVFSSIIYPIIIYNVILGAFNLLPVEPLDGFKIVNGLLPPKLSLQWVQLAPLGLYVLVFLIVTNTTSKLISPVVNIFINVLGL